LNRLREAKPKPEKDKGRTGAGEAAYSVAATAPKDLNTPGETWVDLREGNKRLLPRL